MTYGFGSVLLRALTFLLLPFYTRYLTTEQYGIVAVAVTITSILAAVLPLGLHGAVARFHYETDSDEVRRRINGTLWLAVVVFAASISALLELAGPSLFRLIVPSVPFQPYIRLAIWTAFLTSLGLVPLAILQVQERPRPYVALTTLASAASLALVACGVIVLRWEARGYLLGSLGGAAVAALAYVAVAMRMTKPAIDREHLRAALVYALPLVPHAIAGWVLELSDRAILARYVSLSDVGVYALGYQLGAALGILTSAFTSAWVPHFFRGLSKNDPVADRELSRLNTYFIITIVFCCLGWALLAEPVLRLLLAPAYHESYRITIWVAWAYVLVALYIVPVSVLFWKKTTWLIPLVSGSAGILSLGLNLLLIPRVGYIAAAWNTLACYAAMLFMAWWLSRRQYSFPYEYRRIATVLGAGLALFGMGVGAAAAFPAASLVVRLAAWVALPGLMLVLGIMSPGEMRSAAGIFVRRPQPGRS